ncbi:unnamed protein product, partial [marine sediment metagenome]
PLQFHVGADVSRVSEKVGENPRGTGPQPYLSRWGSLEHLL